MTDRIEDAMELLEKRVDLTEDGETIVVKNKKGEITTEKIETFLETTFRAEKGWLYGGTGASGSDFGKRGDPIEIPPADQAATRTQEHRARAAASI
jgi:polyribonucleotide nucleotidyltransferase